MISSASKQYFDLNASIKTIDVTYEAGENLDKNVSVKSQYVDINTSKNTKGTVVSLSGSPGSHNDFKYMKDLFEKKNIRLIATNWPGSEFVSGGLEDSFRNNERNSYVTALMKKLEVDKVNKLVIMGHSRGGENAFQIASILSRDEKWPLVGTLAINSPGFAPHKGITVRMWMINLIANLIHLQSKIVNFMLYPILHYFYNNVIGLRVANGKIAGAAILPMRTFAFEKQKLTIDELKKSEKVRIFYGYGAKDFLIDESQSNEFAMYINRESHFVIHNKNEAQKMTSEASGSIRSGERYVTACFKEEGHFLQKTYPDFLIEVIDAMFEATDKSRI